MNRDLRLVTDDFSREQASLLTRGGGDGTSSGMEARVKKLEDDMTEIKVTLGRIDERLAGLSTNLASKADVSKIEGKLDSKLGLWQFLGVIAVLLGIMTRWPDLFRLVSPG